MSDGAQVVSWILHGITASGVMTLGVFLLKLSFKGGKMVEKLDNLAEDVRQIKGYIMGSK